jgi:glycosyltransferase involved in cell wall biosynthesis
MVGRINWLKGQEVFVKAARKVLDSGCNAHFLIVGDCFKKEEIYLKNLKKLISELKLDDKVEILGFVKDVGSLYGKMGMLVIPSTQPESFGLVAIEAMSMRKPVIASNIGALPEVVTDGETGILFEPGNDEQLKDAILRLAGDETLRRRMGDEGLKRQKTYFTEERFQKQINNIILTITEGH